MRHERINKFSTGLAAAASAGLRVVFAAIAGLVLLLSALLLAACLGGLVLLGKLAGGRRASMASFGWRRRTTKARRTAMQGDVIDVEVREIA